LNEKILISNLTAAETIIAFPAADRLGAVMAFSLRTGGQSPAPFDSLNFSVSHGDSPENVRQNFANLGQRIGIDPEKVVTCRQVHGDRIHVVESARGEILQADAIVTAEPNIFPAIKTADCLPILILDPVRKLAAAVHAGWRGTVLRITRKTVEFMGNTFRSDPSNLVIGIGPGIGPCCYEVDGAVLKPFRKDFPDPERFISVHNSDPNSKKSHHLDLLKANRSELIAMGVSEQNIHSADLCTACHPALFFSHRRDGAKSGRHIALVGFRG
jgi:polyphenol oxidase